MNKQGKEIKKTAHNTVISAPLLYIHFLYKSSRSTRRQHGLNTHAITILVASYLYYKLVNPLFSIYHIQSFLGVYDSVRVKKYLIQLSGIGLLTQSGGNKYSLTDQGIEAIDEISHNSESLIYDFCSKYGIEL